MKKLLSFLIPVIGVFSVDAKALANPSVGLAVVDTPYGVYACKQRAQTKLYSMGATGVSSLSSGNTIWGLLGDNKVGVWCRGSEAVVVVAGDSDVIGIRDDIRFAF